MNRPSFVQTKRIELGSTGSFDRFETGAKFSENLDLQKVDLGVV